MELMMGHYFGKLKQVLYNLLSNAAKFSTDGDHIILSAKMVSRTWIETRLPTVFKEDCLAVLQDSDDSF